MTKIEWTERTWNPIVGCSIVSPGCKNCFAMAFAARLERMLPKVAMVRVGKPRAGRLLDGREHSEWPRTEPSHA